MSDLTFLEKVKQMPPDFQQEVRNFIDYMWDKKLKKEPVNSEKLSLFGAFKGKSWMSPDFDEPLEDFKDYM